jgi:hypothetical protein
VRRKASRFLLHFAALVGWISWLCLALHSWCSAANFSFPVALLAPWPHRAGERKNGRLWFKNCTNFVIFYPLQTPIHPSYHEVQTYGDLPMATGTRKIGRDAKTGEFIPVKEAQKRPSTSVVETIKKPSPTSPPKKK